MKASFSNTTATALRGITGWISGWGGTSLGEAEERVPFVVSACGYRADEFSGSIDSSRSGDSRDRWHPGLSLDNFS